MFESLLIRQKVGLFILSAIALFGMGWLGAKRLQQPPPIKIVGAATSESDAKQIAVHITGEVRNPGLIYLPNGARTHDAIAAAGGPTEQAELDSLNLAERIQDGAKLVVPTKGTPTPMPRASEPKPPSDVNPLIGSSAPQGDAAGTIALNSATAEELDQLPGVGPATAKNILEYRDSMGGFQSIDDLLNVKGIGEKKLAKMKPYLRL